MLFQTQFKIDWLPIDPLVMPAMAPAGAAATAAPVMNEPEGATGKGASAGHG